MTDRAIVLRKLSALTEHIGRLRRRMPSTAEALRDDVDRQDALAMSFLVSVQAVLDIAVHIASDDGFGVAPTYAGAFQLLADCGVITQQTSDQLGRMAALRNRIAHGYVTVDFARLWQELPAGISAFLAFEQQIAARLGAGS